MKKYYYGYIPDFVDKRDRKLSLAAPEKLAESVDFRAKCSPIYDQGGIGSCTANAIASAYDFLHQKNNLPFISPSRLFIYYNEREIEGQTEFDSGAQIRDGIKTLSNLGVCLEESWPYDPNSLTVKPKDTCYNEALSYLATKYERLDTDLNQLKATLSNGYPFVFGFSVYESFESEEVAKSGVMPIPTPSESLLGGHAVMCVGYYGDEELFIVRNSWGTSWGQSGYFLMPFQCMLDYASDIWVILEDE